MISLDFLQGRVTYDELSLLQNLGIEHQLNDLKEDMLQVEYPDGFLLDVGWYPSFDIKGNFNIKIIKDYQWESPTLTLTAHSIDTLNKALLFAQLTINTERQKSETRQLQEPSATRLLN